MGILSAIAIPSFKGFAARSRSKEVELNLANAYSALTAFESQFAGFANCLHFMGYKPAGIKGSGLSTNPSDSNYSGVSERFFSLGFNNSSNHTSWISTSEFNPLLCPVVANQESRTFFSGSKMTGSNVGFGSLASSATQGTFRVIAAGIISTDAIQNCPNTPLITITDNMACYTIDDLKNITIISRGY